MSAAGLRARLRIARTGGFSLDLDLELPARGITALHGPSGAGKSTCLRLIAGLERADGCSITMADTVWQDGATFVAPHRRAIGCVFQDANLFPHLEVAGNLDYGRSRRDREGKVDRAHLIELLGIGALLTRDPATLSGGERQRVAIARALLSAPRLLLMDEPLASVDAPRKEEFLAYLDRLHAELDIPVIYVTHSEEEIRRLADHVVRIANGRIVSSP